MNLCPKWFKLNTTAKKAKAHEQGMPVLAAAAAATPKTGSTTGVGAKGGTKAKAKSSGPKAVLTSVLKRPSAAPVVPPAKRLSGPVAMSNVSVPKPYPAAPAPTTGSTTGVGGKGDANVSSATLEERRRLKAQTDNAVPDEEEWGSADAWINYRSTSSSDSNWPKGKGSWKPY